MKFWINFSGYVCVEAKTEEEAEKLFWKEFIPNNVSPFSDDEWDINCIEEREI